MEDIKIVFKFMKNLMWAFVAEGILSIIFAILIFLYPYLLIVLVSLLLLLWGITALYLAYKIGKYSSVKIDMPGE